MQTNLAEFIRDTPEGEEAKALLQRCVHCGFCNATCPTYQLLGDELDGPRGRIYLIKQVLEGVQPTPKTQQHLDRCLTCRACETTCPSGVQYGRLADIGRKVVDSKVTRSPKDRVVRALLREGLTSPLFGPALRLGQVLRPFLPSGLAAKVPRRNPAEAWPTRSHIRKVLLLQGCVQPAMAPNINAATARVLDAIGIETQVAHDSGCCGAIRFHLSDQAGGRDDARRNVDAWWPYVMNGVEAIVTNASGCGAMVMEYAYLLRDDPAYAEKANRICTMAKDVSEVVSDHAARLVELKHTPDRERVAFHPPCTLQHAQRIRGAIEQLLVQLGADVVPFSESHLCCGSAGTYSVVQPTLSEQLRDRKLTALLAAQPDRILSANIGCIAYLGSASPIPVTHWIEWLDARLARE